VFGVWHTDSDVKTVMPPATKLSELDFVENELVVGFPDQFEIREMVTVAAPVLAASLTRSVVLSGDQMVIQFREVRTDKSFTRRLSRSANVDDAKQEVAAYLGAPSGEYITLLHNGKPLKGSFLLSRLRLRGELSVFVRVDEAVLLQSARAMR
jgi:hypothetical protein